MQHSNARLLRSDGFGHLSEVNLKNFRSIAHPTSYEHGNGLKTLKASFFSQKQLESEGLATRIVNG